MKCTYNFSAGPAVLPKSVMLRAQAEMLDWHGSGMSVMEMSHRGKHYMSIIEKVESDFRSLFNVPKNYKVLFLQGGAIALIKTPYLLAILRLQLLLKLLVMQKHLILKTGKLTHLQLMFIFVPMKRYTVSNTLICHLSKRFQLLPICPLTFFQDRSI
jgi:hypothetical protein